MDTFKLACIASVSVWFRSKERPRNGILDFGRARNETRAKKMKVGGRGREGRKRGVLFTLPMDTFKLIAVKTNAKFIQSEALPGSGQ